jgi:putative ABC transport system permease protein
MNDLRFALRRLSKAPGFSFVVILTLAVALGGNTAIFSVVSATYLRSIPFADPGRLLFLSERNATYADMSISYPNYLDWEKQQDVFSAMTLFRGDGGKLRTARGAEQVSVVMATGAFMETLGVTPVQGRAMRPEDDREGAEPVVWLSHGAWQEHFEGDREIVGRTIEFDGRGWTVAGVLPADFRFVRQTDLLLPLAPLAEARFMKMRENHNGCYAIARLKPGVDLKEAQARMAVIGQRLASEYPTANAGIGVAVTSLRDRVAGGARQQLLFLLGAVLLVQLIASVNVANMMLARALGRERESAIQVALGASPRDLARQAYSEAVVLAVIGGAIGAALGLWGCGAAAALVPWEVRNLGGAEGLGIDWRVLTFVGVLSLTTGAGFSVLPALWLSRADPALALKDAPRGLTVGRHRFRVSDVLVSAQVALAVLLLVSAGLLIRSLQRLAQVPPGFEAERVLSLRVASPPMEAVQSDPFAAVRYHERILAAVERLPEVEAAAFGTSVPFTWSVSSMVFYRDDRPLPDAAAFPVANSHFATPSYFRTMGIPLLRGRLFDGTEPEPKLPPGAVFDPRRLGEIYRGIDLVGVVSRRMAEKYWPGEDPIGKRFRMGFPQMDLPTVVVAGIVGNTTQQGQDRGEEAEFYVSIRQVPIPVYGHLLVRTRVPPAAAAAAVRAAVTEASGGEPVFDLRPMADRVLAFRAGRRLNMSLYAFFGGTALLLSAVGIYGVLGFSVGRRTREFGVRMALGASRATVMRGVLVHSAWLVLPGAAAGLAGALALSRTLASQLFEIGADDPATYAAAVSALLLAALVASLAPVLRAVRVDPLVALREG